VSDKAIFVIGAGASKEANLPTGLELKGKIANLVDIRFQRYSSQISGDHLITEALRSLVRKEEGGTRDINPYLHEGWHIRDALPLAISIDNFIDSQRDNEKIKLMGKLGIVRSILEAENRSLLFYDKTRVESSIKYGNIIETWYLPFFQLLTENCEKKELSKRLSKIVLIIFNYDRCVEHFLHEAIQQYYKTDRNEAAELLSSIEIFHPYGKVGSLPWESDGFKIDFGAEPSAEDLLRLSDEIKTFTEGTDPDSSEILTIKSNIMTAKILVFMGFAFHKLNMSLISPQDIQKTSVKCFASAFGLSDSDKIAVKDQISRLYQADVDINIATLPCYKFLTEYWRSLAF
jgi:hypothetical protein